MYNFCAKSIYLVQLNKYFKGVNAKVAKKGITKLPIGVPLDTAIKIFELLSSVNYKIGRLEEKFNSSIVSDSLIQIFLMSESVQSTRIEGTQVTFTDLLEEKNKKKKRWEIIEVNNYFKALNEGYDAIKKGDPISTRLIKRLHKILMHDARGSTQARGEFRKVQNFIGPTNRIEDATYIPIPADEIDEYMENLELYIHKHPYGKKLPTEHLNQSDYIFDEDADPIVKTAIIHAQFESIHPFLDGNGRLGRILIVLSFLQCKLISKPILFVSEELEKERSRYYDMLNGVRGENPNWGAWIIYFIQATKRMADKIYDKLEKAEELAKAGLRKCAIDSEKNVWLYTFSNPSATAKEAAEALGISPNTARNALNNLSEKDLLYMEQGVQRNKKYWNYDLLRILRE